MALTRFLLSVVVGGGGEYVRVLGPCLPSTYGVAGVAGTSTGAAGVFAVGVVPDMIVNRLLKLQVVLSCLVVTGICLTA